MNKKTLVKQHDITDCGAACLASIAAHYKLQLPISKIRQYASTDKKGTNVLGMVEASQKLGFQAKGVKGTIDSLNKIPKPAIAHIVIKEVLHHFVVIYGVTEKIITIMDPTDGRLHKKNIEDFKKEWTGILIILLPDEKFTTGNEKISPFKRFWYLLQPHKTVMLQAFFGATIYTILGLSTSIYIQKITDYVIPESNKNLLNLLSIGMLILLFIQVFVGSIKSIFALRTGQQIDARLILGYYKHLLQLPQQFFDTMRVGEIISRVNDAVKIRIFINDVAISFVVNVLVVVFSFALMFTYYWKLALVMLVIIPIYVFMYIIVNKINRIQQRKLMENVADLETHLVESITSVTTIKRFGLEQFAGLNTETRFVAMLRTTFGAGLTAIYSNNLNEFISRLFTIILLWAGGYYVIQQNISAGELLSFYALIGYFTGPAGQLIVANKTIQEALIAADRLFDIMDLEREESSTKINLLSEFIGDIKFENVSFRYGARAPLFKNLTFIAPKGHITAIVGESGSGKSTIISLIQNLYPLQSGSISLGNYDIRHISNESLRQKVAVVPQQTDLFAGNFIDNIAVGDFNPNLPKILHICEQLGISEFVQKLPQGYGTYIGENGASLSGGQRQRLSIARAIYRDPEILMLDEATSSLDSLSENFVQNIICKLKSEGKTIIIISHRLSSIKTADKIIVLENGILAEEGIHEKLLENNMVYSKLWEQQIELK